MARRASRSRWLRGGRGEQRPLEADRVMLTTEQFAEYVDGVIEILQDVRAHRDAYRDDLLDLCLEEFEQRRSELRLSLNTPLDRRLLQ